MAEALWQTVYEGGKPTEILAPKKSKVDDVPDLARMNFCQWRDYNQEC